MGFFGDGQTLENACLPVLICSSPHGRGEEAGTASSLLPPLGRHRGHSAGCTVFADQAAIPCFLQVEASPGLHLAYQL